VDGSELVFILMPIGIPLFLALGIAAPYIADSVAKAAGGSNVQPQDSNYFDQKLHSCSFIYQATILGGEKTVYQVIGNGAQPFWATRESTWTETLFGCISWRDGQPYSKHRLGSC
jgi:hypothetical protein